MKNVPRLIAIVIDLVNWSLTLFINIYSLSKAENMHYSCCLLNWHVTMVMRMNFVNYNLHYRDTESTP